jgi:hypothetical protein
LLAFVDAGAVPTHQSSAGAIIPTVRAVSVCVHRSADSGTASLPNSTDFPTPATGPREGIEVNADCAEGVTAAGATAAFATAIGAPRRTLQLAVAIGGIKDFWRGTRVDAPVLALGLSWWARASPRNTQFLIWTIDVSLAALLAFPINTEFLIWTIDVSVTALLAFPINTDFSSRAIREPREVGVSVTAFHAIAVDTDFPSRAIRELRDAGVVGEAAFHAIAVDTDLPLRAVGPRAAAFHAIPIDTDLPLRAVIGVVGVDAAAPHAIPVNTNIRFRAFAVVTERAAFRLLRLLRPSKHRNRR